MQIEKPLEKADKEDRKILIIAIIIMIIVIGIGYIFSEELVELRRLLEPLKGGGY